MVSGYARAAFVIGITVVGLSASVLAEPRQRSETPARQPPEATSLPPLSEVPADGNAVNPYARLFPIPRVTSGPADPPDRTGATPRPSIVCGMVVIDADPRVDPEFLVTAPNAGTSFTMPRLDFGVCQ